MPLNRTWFNTLVDDDGSNTIGTLWDKAAVDHVYDDVDAALLPLETAPPVQVLDDVTATSFATGTQHDWNLISGTTRNTLSKWQGPSDLTATGLAGGTAGRRWTFRNIGGRVAFFPYNHAGSAAANRFYGPLAAAGILAVAPTGWATWQHDGAGWALVAFEQGAWITPTYNAADFTSNVGSWTVDAGDLATYAYRLSGKTLTVSFYIQATTVSGTPTQLRIKIPGGFTAAKSSLHPLIHDDAGAGNAGSFCLLAGAGATTIDCYKAYGAGSFANATNTTRLFSTISFEVQ